MKPAASFRPSILQAGIQAGYPMRHLSVCDGLTGGLDTPDSLHPDVHAAVMNLVQALQIHPEDRSELMDRGTLPQPLADLLNEFLGERHHSVA